MAGIAGNTVEQVKNNLSYSEFIDWIAYTNKNGPLNQAKRIEQTLALIAAMFANAMFKKQNGEKFKIDDFSVYAEDEPQEINPEGVLAMLSAMAKKNKG